MSLLWLEQGVPERMAMQSGLRELGWQVDAARDGHSALRMMRPVRHAAFVLEVFDDGADALWVPKAAWQAGAPPPILVLTPVDDSVDRTRWLDAGADRCVSKPIAATDLCARLRALIRALRTVAQQRLTWGDLVVDPVLRTARCGSRPLRLPARELDLLLCLMHAAGRTLSRAELERSLYGGASPVASNAIEVHLHHLRRKLGRGRLVTVKGLGYRLLERPGDGK